MLFTVAAGIDFNRFLRKFGRKRTLYLQQISYLTLIMVGLHALLLGTLTRQINVLRLYIIVSFIFVITLRVYLLFDGIVTKKRVNKSKIFPVEQGKSADRMKSI